MHFTSPRAKAQYSRCWNLKTSVGDLVVASLKIPGGKSCISKSGWIPVNLGLNLQVVLVKYMQEEFFNNTVTCYFMSKKQSYISGRFDLWKHFHDSIPMETYGRPTACCRSPGLVLPFWSKKRMKLLGTLGEGTQRQVPQLSGNQTSVNEVLAQTHAGWSSINFQDLCRMRSKLRYKTASTTI